MKTLRTKNDDGAVALRSSEPGRFHSVVALAAPSDQVGARRSSISFARLRQRPWAVPHVGGPEDAVLAALVETAELLGSAAGATSWTPQA